LGDNKILDRKKPIKLENIKGVKFIVGGDYHTFIVKENGDVRA
jgi:hypothetical protein